jgi:hypothetical protein
MTPKYSFGKGESMQILLWKWLGVSIQNWALFEKYVMGGLAGQNEKS